MKVTVNQKVLASAAKDCFAFVPKKAIVPIANSFKLKASKGKFYIMVHGIKAVAVPAQIEEEGEICIGAKIFTEIAGALHDRQNVVLSTNDETFELKIAAQKEDLKWTVFTLYASDTKDFDEPRVADNIHKITIPAKQFESLIQKTLFATAKQDIKPVYQGVEFVFEKNKISAYSNDRSRLVDFSVSCRINQKTAVSCVIPRDTLLNLAKVLPGKKSISLQIAENFNYILFTLDNNTKIYSNLIEGSFKDGVPALLDDFKTTVQFTLKREDLLSKLFQMQFITTDNVDNGSPVNFAITDEGVELTTADRFNTTNATIYMNVENSEEIKDSCYLSLNINFLIDFCMNNPDAKCLKFYFSKPLDYCLIKTDISNLVYFICPVKTEFTYSHYPEIGLPYFLQKAQDNLITAKSLLNSHKNALANAEKDLRQALENQKVIPVLETEIKNLQTQIDVEGQNAKKAIDAHDNEELAKISKVINKLTKEKDKKQVQLDKFQKSVADIPHFQKTIEDLKGLIPKDENNIANAEKEVVIAQQNLDEFNAKKQAE